MIPHLIPHLAGRSILPVCRKVPLSWCFVVGLAGFEPTTPCPPAETNPLVRDLSPQVRVHMQ